VIVTWVVVGVAAVLLLWLGLTYNRLVAHRNRARQAWSGIDVQLTRRADLVPRLVETVQGYKLHERELLSEVTAARTNLIESNGPREAGAADDRLEGALQHLFAVAEAYPDLKASELFLTLQRELSTLEEDISFARRYHNAVTERFNTAQQRFPALLVAGVLGFSPREYFKAEEADRVAPSAGFDR
jgi:LemA protein